jgi:hypothetical protein
LNILLQNLIGNMRKDLYLLKNSYRENRRYDIEYVLYITLKTLMEKLGEVRYGLVLLLPH